MMIFIVMMIVVEFSLSNQIALYDRLRQVIQRRRMITTTSVNMTNDNGMNENE